MTPLTPLTPSPSGLACAHLIDQRRKEVARLVYWNQLLHQQRYTIYKLTLPPTSSAARADNTEGLRKEAVK